MAVMLSDILQNKITLTKVAYFLEFFFFKYKSSYPYITYIATMLLLLLMVQKLNSTRVAWLLMG